jgi:ABC-type dipeptide/oligopeptide/nickel transport system permease component
VLLTQVLRRLLEALPTLLGVAVAVFVILRIVPGDPIAMMVVGEATPEDIANVRAAYGLDKSMAEQFLIYMKDLATGNLGKSISLKLDVVELVLDRLPATLELALLSIVFAVAAGFALALASIYWRGVVEHAADQFNSVALAIPEFLWALLLVLLFGVALPVLPISGRIDPTLGYQFASQFYLLESLVTLRWGQAWEVFQHMILPATALSLPLVAIIARVLKSSLLEALVQDYILLARTKGFTPARVLLRHALPNALLPTITIAGVHFTFLVGGTVLVELIFAYPGVGNMLFGAAINRDLPLIQGVAILFALIFVFMNLAVDLLCALVNVRLRSGRG